MHSNGSDTRRAAREFEARRQPRQAVFTGTAGEPVRRTTAGAKTRLRTLGSCSEAGLAPNSRVTSLSVGYADNSLNGMDSKAAVSRIDYSSVCTKPDRPTISATLSESDDPPRLEQDPRRQRGTLAFPTYSGPTLRYWRINDDSPIRRCIGRTPRIRRRSPQRATGFRPVAKCVQHALSVHGAASATSPRQGRAGREVQQVAESQPHDSSITFGLSWSGQLA